MRAWRHQRSHLAAEAAGETEMVNHRIAATLAFALAMAAITGGQPTPVGDWPQWRGPDRTGLSKESGLIKQWPASGPAAVWSAANLGAGYGSIAVSGNRI